MNPIEELKGVIHKLHGATATHRESVPVKETFNGETVWEGIVEVFSPETAVRAVIAQEYRNATA